MMQVRAWRYSFAEFHPETVSMLWKPLVGYKRYLTMKICFVVTLSFTGQVYIFNRNIYLFIISPRN